MNFTCNECNDSGSRDKLGTYLDCNACGTAATRRDLNDFVKSLGPTHPEDVALAIHQRALAMVPKQEAQEPVAWRVRDGDEWEYYNHFNLAKNSLAWPDGNGVDPLPPPEPLYAVPVAANGALTEDEGEALADLKNAVLIGGVSDEWLLGFIRQTPLAAAGPDAALVALIHKAQSILAQHLPPDGPDAKTTISALLGLLDGPESRAALSGAKGN